MKKYILKIKLSKEKSRALGCGRCHFEPLCKYHIVDLYTCGLFSQAKAQRIMKSDLYFEISRMYEDISSVYFKNKTTKKEKE